ncbi:hypothetical protein BJV82DRAFT_597567 [Fennellomyces sp. T-0311]|nr:hypothetical protein BJV82DRAFT_597567 [Fennellomyces sp. T-0311]
MSSNTQHKPTVGIIGGGFSGIAAAIRVKQELGITAHIFEGSDDLGGTWYHNTYPNCACDVPSHLYSLSFEPNYNWSQRFSNGAEIHQYMQGIARKHGLYEQTSLNTQVLKATWIEEDKKWKLDLRKGDELTFVYFDMIYLSVGSIRVPHVPEEFKGFQGTVVHTAYWDPNVDFTDKRVAVIGSGASAIQTIPALVKQASKLVTYQRTPAWVLVRKQYYYSRLAKFIFRWIPFANKIYRFMLFLSYESSYLLFGYYSSIYAKIARKFLAYDMKRRILKQGRPDLVSKLVPDYPPGCKRLTQSEDYLEALCEEHVTVERTAIQSIKGRTITTVDGNENEFDILCLATGFNVQGFLGNLEVQGKDKGQTLNEAWSDSFPDSYKSVLINGYPNLFMILGPSSLLGHNSVLIMTEGQVDYSIKCIKKMIKGDVVAIEPTLEAQSNFVKNLKEDLKTTVWKGGCNSWYLDARGDVTALWSSTVTRFLWLLRRVGNTSDFITYTK